MANEHLKLENQICFPMYAASQLIIQEYQSYLDKLGITYPQPGAHGIMGNKQHFRERNHAKVNPEYQYGHPDPAT